MPIALPADEPQCRQRLNIGAYGFRGIPSTYSGYETFLTVALAELAKRGHTVTAYCRAGEVEPSSEYKGVRKSFIWSLNTKNLHTLSHGVLCSFVARARRHDVVFVVNPANALFCGLSKVTGQPVVLNTDGQEWARGKWGRLGRAFFKVSARFAGVLTTALISDCAAMARIYAEQFRTASTVIPYCWTGLDPPGESDLLRRLRITKYRYNCIAGRLVPENNAVPVVQAYRSTELTEPLVVAGGANYDSPVQRQLLQHAANDERIILAGHISDRAEYAALVRYARVYVHAHSVGGINPSLIEAMGLGASIVALKTPFNTEAVGQAGSFFNDFDSDLLSAISMRYAMTASQDLEMRERARERARTEYSVESVVDAIENLLCEAASGSSWRSFSMPSRWSSSIGTLREAGGESPPRSQGD